MDLFGWLLLVSHWIRYQQLIFPGPECLAGSVLVRHGLAGFPLLGQIASLHNAGHILGAGMCQVIHLQDDSATEVLRAALKLSALGQPVRRHGSLSDLQCQPPDVLREPDLQKPLILVCTELQKGKMRITVGDSPLQERDRPYLWPLPSAVDGARWCLGCT